MELELSGNNLYRNGYVLEFAGTEERLLLREPVQYDATVQDTYHRVSEEDRLDLLAYRYYSGTVEDASKYWWVLADVNNILNPLDLSSFIGKDLVIPNILTILLKLQ